MKIAIVDDTDFEREFVKRYILNWAEINKCPVEVTEYTAGGDFLINIAKYPVDIVLMDIFMDGLNGIETATKMRELSMTTILIFITTSIEYMQDAFSCRSFDYIIKPVDEAKLGKVMNDAVSLLSKLPKYQPYIKINSHKKEIPILYANIEYVVSDSNYIYICVDGIEYKYRMSFKSISASLLNDNRFCVINRGVLVNFDYVIKMEKSTCNMRSGKLLAVNIRNSSKLRQALTAYRFNNKRDLIKRRQV